MYQLCADPIESTKDINIVECVVLFILPNWYFAKDFESGILFHTGNGTSSSGSREENALKWVYCTVSFQRASRLYVSYPTKPAFEPSLHLHACQND